MQSQLVSDGVYMYLQWQVLIRIVQPIVMIIICSHDIALLPTSQRLQKRHPIWGFGEHVVLCLIVVKVLSCQRKNDDDNNGDDIVVCECMVRKSTEQRLS